MSFDQAMAIIVQLVDCDDFEDIATLRNVDELLGNNADLSQTLCQIGDSIVYKLVQWTKRLPFYSELPVAVHTQLLTHKWHELLVLTTSAYQAIRGGSQPWDPDPGGGSSTTGTGASSAESDVKSSSANTTNANSSFCAETDFGREVAHNLSRLQRCLTSMMGRPITMDQLRHEVGIMVEKITHVIVMFRRLRLTMDEYVCLKVITMLNHEDFHPHRELEAIQERYVAALKTFVETRYPHQPTRFGEILVRLPEMQSAAALLLQSKMFYVPFLLNSTIPR